MVHHIIIGFMDIQILVKIKTNMNLNNSLL